MADGESPAYRAINLGIPTRWVSGVLGLAAGGAGGYSVFVNTNQAGSTALLLLGGIFLLIALTGRVPERIGKDGLDYQPTADAVASTTTVTELMDDAPPEVREAVARSYERNLSAIEQALAAHLTDAGTRTATSDQVRNTALHATIGNRAAARGINLEANITRLIEQKFSTAQVHHNGVVDLMMTLPNSKKIGIEIKGRKVTRDEEARLLLVAELQNLDTVVVVEALAKPHTPWVRKSDEKIVVVQGTGDDTGEIAADFANLILTTIEDLSQR
ncbi:hypothetical protein [Rhodococcus sp. JT-3]|uniref:hypothetical protein n=1 Tax=Rhodococcus sp. JT-3 TaxID=1973213 RepID=UPI00130314BF|nr:hypothetical protein [Rhodococcus sp. JT-3]